MLLLTVVAIIAVALAFDYINGFHDAANSIATVVSTRSPGTPQPRRCAPMPIGTTNGADWPLTIVGLDYGQHPQA